MTYLGFVGLGLVALSAIGTVLFVGCAAFVLLTDWVCDWDARRRVESRLREDAQVAELDAIWNLPIGGGHA